MTDSTLINDSNKPITKFIKKNKIKKEILCDAEFDIWSIITESQNTNGLRYNDYQRYRQYCTRKLHRIRKSTNHVLYHQKSKKYRYTDVVSSDIYDIKLLSIPLYQSERSWSYSCEIRDELTADNERTKYHMRNRLHKSAQYSVKLQNLVDIHCNLISQLHTLIYTTWLIGLDYTEMRLYTLALQYFTCSINTIHHVKLYSNINVQSVLDDKSQQLNNLIRVCTYNQQQYGDNTTVQQSRYHTYCIDNINGRYDELNKLSLNTGEKNDMVDGSNAVQYAGKSITIANAAVYNVLQITNKSIQSIQFNNINSNNSTTYVTTVKQATQQYDDALKQTRVDISNTKSDAIKQTLLQLQNYIIQHKYESTLLRYTIQLQSMIQQYHIQQSMNALTHNKSVIKPLSIVQLYDKQISVCKQLAELSTQSKYVDLLQYTSIIQLIYQAMRCYYVAESYRSRRLYIESYAVYNKTLQRIEQVQSHSSHTHKFNEQHTNMVQLLQSQIDNIRTDIPIQKRIVSALHNNKSSAHHDTATDTTKLTKQQIKLHSQHGMVERLHEWINTNSNSVPTVVSRIPAFQSTPNKPILFDIAYNGIDWPIPYNMNTVHNADTGNDTTTDQQKGLLGRLFGR